MQDSELQAEVEEYFALGARVKPGDVVLDVGANVGAFAEQVAGRCASDVSLYCFEPVPDLFARLARSFVEDPVLRQTRHALVNAALTHPRGDDTIELSYFRRLPTDSTCDIERKREQFEAAFEAIGERARAQCEATLGARLGEPLGDWLARGVSVIPRGRFGAALTDLVTGRTVVECAASTLDTQASHYGIDRIDLMKIDVEGAELDVLRGGADALARCAQVVLEGHASDGREAEAVSLLQAGGLTARRSVRPPGARALGLDNYLLLATRE